jgi:alpha-tubulin suppressor-like RCC1 family protein
MRSRAVLPGSGSALFRCGWQPGPSAAPPRLTRFSVVLAAALLLAALGCREDDGPLTAPEGGPTLATAGVAAALEFVQVSPGAYHTCGVTTTGRVYCWGYNYFGQLGDGTTTQRLRPVAVHAGTLRFRLVTAGDYHSCGVTTDNRAYCWGNNLWGQLGVGGGTTADRLTPVLVAGGLTFRQVRAAGFGHTCGIAMDFRAYCWGLNQAGELGDRTETNRFTPTLVAGSLLFSQLDPGANYTCGVTTTSVGYCWGANTSGGLGDGTTIRRLTPAAVAGGLRFKHIDASNYSCGVTTDDRVYCWGDNFSGRLGDGTTTQRLVPTAVVGGLRFRGVTVGVSTCAVTSADRVYCWGDNLYGQLGDGTTVPRLTPVPTVGGLSFARLNGSLHVCAVTTANRLYCWGYNHFGQLGDGTTTNRSRPTRVAGG